MKQLTINNILCDIDEQTSIGVDIQGYDIKEPTKQKVSVSNSFSLPKTTKNLRAIGWLGNVQFVDKSIYQKNTCRYSVGNKVLIDGYCNITSISDRINLFAVSKPDFWEDLKKVSWQEFLPLYLTWLNSTYDIPIGTDRETDASIASPNYLTPVINKYKSNSRPLHIPFFISGIEVESDFLTPFSKTIYLNKRTTTATQQLFTGGHITAYISFIFEYLQSAYNVNLNTISQFTGNLFYDNIFNATYIPIKNYMLSTLLWDSSTKLDHWFDYMANPLIKDVNDGSIDCIEDLTLYDFVISVFNMFCVMVDRVGESEYKLRVSDELLNETPIDFSGRYSGAFEFMPIIEGYTQNNYVKFKEVEDNISEYSNSVNVPCLNENIDFESDLVEINGFIPAVFPLNVGFSLNDFTLLLNTQKSFKTFIFLRDSTETTSGIIQKTTDINYVDITSNASLYWSSLVGIGNEYDFLKTIAEYPVTYNVKKWLTLTDIIALQNWQLAYVKELNGSFFINKISGYNPDSKEATDIELIKVNNATLQPQIMPPSISQWDYDDGDDFFNYNYVTINYKINIVSVGGSEITSMGLAIGTTHSPTTKYEEFTSGTVGITTLACYDGYNGFTPIKNTDYYIRPYVTNSFGTTYGRERVLLCMGIEKNTGTFNTLYSTELIGAQLWTKFNCSVGEDVTAYYPDNNPIYEQEYGLLYDWTTANTLAPSGWHLPTKSEYETLSAYLGGDSIAGGKLKEAGAIYWDSPNTGADNSARFYARGAGWRHSGNIYNDFKEKLNLVTNTDDGTDAYILTLENNTETVQIDVWDKEHAMSVRFIKD